MQCDHQLVSNHLFDYLDEQLSPTIKKRFEQALDHCENCQVTYHQAVTMQRAANQWQQQPVPQWHHTKYAVRPRSASANWLSWSALATSTLAIMMVMFQFQISSTEHGIEFSFGGKSNVQVNQLIEEKLLAYQREQNTLLNARLLSESSKLNTASKLMMLDFMEKNRAERRDDLNFLVTGIQAQRFDDQQKVEKHLTYLAENQIENNQYINQLIQSANLKTGAKP